MNNTTLGRRTPYIIIFMLQHVSADPRGRHKVVLQDTYRNYFFGRGLPFTNSCYLVYFNVIIIIIIIANTETINVKKCFKIQCVVKIFPLFLQLSNIRVKVKVNFTLEQSTKTQKGRRDISLLFL